ncbi:MAG: hypothetical protein FJ255_04675 [Phycisphaerae bacterium]|nr:hypothetical protein [Phycisphaerae bacterium]
MSADTPAASVIVAALVAMVLCRVLGTMVAHVCGRLADDAVRRHKESNPVPDVRAAYRAAHASTEGGGA